MFLDKWILYYQLLVSFIQQNAMLPLKKCRWRQHFLQYGRKIRNTGLKREELFKLLTVHRIAQNKYRRLG